MFKSLKIRMNAGFAAIIFVSVLLIGAAVSIYSTKESVRLFEQHARQQMSTVASAVELFYDELEKDINILAEYPALRRADSSLASYAASDRETSMTPSLNGGVEQRVYEMLEHYGRNRPGTLRLCIGTEDAGYVQWPEAVVSAHYDPRTQPWYLEGMRSEGRVRRLEPYAEQAGGDVVIRTVRSFRNMEGEPYGVVAVDVEMRKLARMLTRKPTGDTGYIMMIHESGAVLADLTFPKDSLESVSELIIEEFEQLHEPPAGFRTMIGGEKYIMNSVKSNTTGWIFAAFGREEEVLRATRAIQEMVLLISVAVGLVGVILIILLSSVLTDIVKAQEQKIRESKKLFQTVIDNSSALIYVKDLEGRYILGNNTWRRRSAPGVADPIGLTDFDLFSEDVAASLRENDRRTLETLTPLNWEEAATDETGERVDYYSVKFPLFDSEGKPYAVCGMSTDITGRRKMEEALREKEARLRVIFEKSPLGLSLHANDGTILDCNGKFVDLMGSSKDKLIGFNSLRTGSTVVKEVFTRALAGESGVLETEYTSYTGGKTTFLRISFNPVEPESPATRVLVALEDITDRKRAEEILQESELRHRIIFENSPLGMIRFSDDGTILDCNDKFVELMGSTREKLIGFNTARQSSPEMREKIRIALEGEPSVYENEYTSVNGGRTVYLRVVFNPIDPGKNPTGVIATLEDITEAKRAEAALRESEMRHRIIFEKSPLGLVRFDSEGIITDCNSRYIEIMGSSREKLIGFDAARLAPPEVRKKILIALKGEPSVYEGEFESVTGGRTFFMRAVLNPLDPGRHSSGVIGTVEDITERKIIERQIGENLEDLERFSRLVIGREERMIRLKEEINTLLAEQGIGPRYRIPE